MSRVMYQSEFVKGDLLNAIMSLAQSFIKELKKPKGPIGSGLLAKVCVFNKRRKVCIKQTLLNKYIVIDRRGGFVKKR